MTWRDTLWEMGDDIEARRKELGSIQPFDEKAEGLEERTRTSAAREIMSAIPGTCFALGASFAAGGALGYAASQGMSVADQGVYLVAIPVASGVVSNVSPLVFEYGLAPAPALTSVGVIGGTTLGVIGYGFGYVAGRLTS